MLDRYNRNINYLRVSVTDRCNLRCTYCMPESGIRLLAHEDILNFDEILDVVRVAVAMGVNKVRITGGEPLVRKGITDLVRMIAGVEGITDLGMTTNGIMLPKFAGELKKAGLHRVNISLDSMDPEKYKAITRIGSLQDALKGIDAAIEAGLTPVKINCVVDKNVLSVDTLSPHSSAGKVKAFADSKGLQIRFIPQMDLHKGTFGEVIGGSGGHCASCNRLRLTPDGMIKPCLFSDLEYSVRELGTKQALLMAVENKPSRGSSSQKSDFYNIGG
ncbi:MAG: radical SAM protein [Bacteroidales bacterium]|nr:radical SAM protein [Bacteroidales bacterium]